MGLNYEPENSDDLVDRINILLDNPNLYEKFRRNAKKLSLEKFDRRKKLRNIGIDRFYITMN